MTKKRLKLRNVVAIAICLAGMATFFTSCDKNELIINDSYVQIWEKPLRIKVVNVENSNGEDIAFAKAIGYYRTGNDEWHNYLEFTSKYKNGGFELKLSDAIADKYLQVASEREDRKGIAISDTKAKFMFFGLRAFNSENSFIGGHLNIRSEKWGISFIYADRDFTEKGVSEYYGIDLDCSYKKGWNVVYNSFDGKIMKYTTQKPLNENFKCYFEIYLL